MANQFFFGNHLHLLLLLPNWAFAYHQVIHKLTNGKQLNDFVHQSSKYVKMLIENSEKQFEYESLLQCMK